MNKRSFLKICILFPLCGAAILFCVFCIAAGAVSLGIPCFSVDANGLLYVGKTNQIDVYCGENIVRRINPLTSRSYIFTILEDDTILLSTSSTVYSMDLYGNVLDTWEDKGADVYNQIQYKKFRYVSAAGDKYERKGMLGWTRIVKNETEVVYRITFVSFAVKLLLYIAIATLIFSVISVLRYENIRMKRNLQ